MRNMWNDKDRREYFVVALICVAITFLLGFIGSCCIIYTIGSGENLYVLSNKVVAIFGWTSLTLTVFMAVSAAQAFSRAFPNKSKRKNN